MDYIFLEDSKKGEDSSRGRSFGYISVSQKPVVRLSNLARCGGFGIVRVQNRSRPLAYAGTTSWDRETEYVY